MISKCSLHQRQEAAANVIGFCYGCHLKLLLLSFFFLSRICWKLLCDESQKQSNFLTLPGMAPVATCTFQKWWREGGIPPPLSLPSGSGHPSGSEQSLETWRCTFTILLAQAIRWPLHFTLLMFPSPSCRTEDFHLLIQDRSNSSN